MKSQRFQLGPKSVFVTSVDGWLNRKNKAALSNLLLRSVDVTKVSNKASKKKKEEEEEERKKY